MHLHLLAAVAVAVVVADAAVAITVNVVITIIAIVVAFVVAFVAALVAATIAYGFVVVVFAAVAGIAAIIFLLACNYCAKDGKSEKASHSHS